MSNRTTELFKLDFQQEGNMPISLVAETESSQSLREERILALTRNGENLSQLAEMLKQVIPDASNIASTIKSELNIIASTSVAKIDAAEIPIPVDPKKLKENSGIMLS